jgi:hypothetical protein
MLVFNKYFYKKKKLKLYFGDRVAVLNDFIYQTGGSTVFLCMEEKKANRVFNQCHRSAFAVTRQQVAASRTSLHARP